MNENIDKLYKIAQKEERLIIGLMSGTSMDGLDVALCKFVGSGGETEVSILAFETVGFAEEIKDEIRKVFAKSTIDFQQLCLLNPWIGNLHAEIINDCLKKWDISPEKIDLIASHGQTVFHAPKILHGLEKFPNATLQIGDGDHIAVKTKIITLSDFRQKHCAAGGEGAPLAVYGDYLIFSKRGENRILLNMGGIANFTYLAGNLDANEVFATDTGTGNTLIDAYVKKHFGLAYDEDAKIASQGNVNKDLLKALKDNEFFSKKLPKTTGPELFNLEYLKSAQEKSHTEELSHEDVLATLCRFSAETIADTIKVFKSDVAYTIYGSGGGVHNPLIMRSLRALLPNCSFMKTDDLGISGDAKEAVLFATLANEAVAGGRTNFGTRKGVPNVSMGKVSFPA
ncbi:Anhydro-N-acetylmuramic acid kinase [Emticicia aquatica]|uniref:Anhydro-N-acetylmuramic acid kinase n=1 Tax=Emticicia aquatica TaxID=1681835 RepID=A0ABN8EYI3_9BACT|nr:anhydro-N-acetylmuramic acid kinase [Emticicia aquatica]CAH0996711.1 Anhydro-N-acetylmuramic acid kinase [Emticicia aquatica]